MKKRGFTIFFAVLVSSLALSVGIVIYDLLQRSLTLSQVATQSQYAIYAADTGAECALYWDLKYTDTDKSAFATSSSDTSIGVGMACNSQNIATGAAPLSLSLSSVSGATAATSTVWVSMGTAASTSCAKVEIAKHGNPSQTTIISHGYNTCSANAPLRLERTLQIDY